MSRISLQDDMTKLDAFIETIDYATDTLCTIAKLISEINDQIIIKQQNENDHGNT